MEVFFFIGIAISALLALLVFNKKERTNSDRIFGIWQLVLLLHFSLLYVRHSELVQEYPHFIGLDSSLVLLHLPFIFFYTSSIVGKALRPTQFMVHLLPFFVMCLVLMWSWFFLPGDEKLRLYNQQLTGQKLFSITDMLLYAQCFLYLPLSYALVKKHSKLITSKYSNIDTMDLSWLEILLMGASSCFGIGLMAHLFYLVSDTIDFQLLSKMNILGFCAFQVVLAYFGIRYTPMFSEIETKRESEVPKYKKTGLDEATARAHFETLQSFMEEHKPYLDAELTLSELASQLDLSANHVSQVINQFTETNFYAYINAYRIEEVSGLLVDASLEQYSILGLAYDAGFKSKSVFNALFKKIKGMTPSQYRKTNRLLSKP